MTLVLVLNALLTLGNLSGSDLQHSILGKVSWRDASECGPNTWYIGTTYHHSLICIILKYNVCHALLIARVIIIMDLFALADSKRWCPYT